MKLQKIIAFDGEDEMERKSRYSYDETIFQASNNYDIVRNITVF
ncbi:MAG: hypothetical protein ACLUQX_03240 [Thomasclavelia spiroformis]